MDITLVTLIIALNIAITSICWHNSEYEQDLIGHPYSTHTEGEVHRLLSSGFLHANLPHLLWNMMSFFSFGESLLNKISDSSFLLIYIGGIVLANIVTYYQQKENYYYYHLGASAGVSAIMAAAILYDPSISVMLKGFISIPGPLFLIIFLLASYWQRESHKIGHLAHLVGALYGIAFITYLDKSFLTTFIRSIFHV